MKSKIEYKPLPAWYCIAMPIVVIIAFTESVRACGGFTPENMPNIYAWVLWYSIMIPLCILAAFAVRAILL